MASVTFHLILMTCLIATTHVNTLMVQKLDIMMGQNLKHMILTGHHFLKLK